MMTTRPLSLLASLTLLTMTAAALGGCGEVEPTTAAETPRPATSPAPPDSDDGTDAPVAPANGSEGTVDVANVIAFTLGKSYCGGVAGQCNGRVETYVSLTQRIVETHECVEGGGSSRFGAGLGDKTTTRAFADGAGDAEFVRLRTALAGLRVRSAVVEAFDGPMEVLDLEVTSGHDILSPEAHCGPAYKKVLAGFQGLKDAVADL